MKKTLISLSIGLAVSLPMSSQAAIANTGSMFFDSEEGNWVGAGMTRSWEHGVEGLFYADRYEGGGISVRVDDGNHWNLIFEPAQYQAGSNTVGPSDLTEGLYENTTRWPFNSPTVPGMSIYGGGRGENRSSGWFQVFEVDYLESGDVASFAVDFMQYGGEEQTGPGLFGSLRFNSDVALHTSPVPIPTAVWLFGSGLAGLIAVGRRRKITNL